ncbi:hypothetical protein, partial, partial [Parasitella parasitica]
MDRLARFYSVPSATHGYRFLYFTSRGRERISEFRAGFNLLGLQQNRILDIHYPDNRTVSFLVHNDYADAVVEAMAKLSAKLLSDFDPLDPALLRDPKYVNIIIIDESFLTSEATRIHQERLIRIVKRLYIPRVQIAVARDFCFTHRWITSDQYRDLYHVIYPNKGSKASSDVPMNDT